jgi:hypothetical protein
MNFMSREVKASIKRGQFVEAMVSCLHETLACFITPKRLSNESKFAHQVETCCMTSAEQHKTTF